MADRPVFRRCKISVTVNGGRRNYNKIFYPDNARDILAFLCAVRVLRVNDILVFSWKATQKGFWDDMRVVEEKVSKNIESVFVKGGPNG